MNKWIIPLLKLLASKQTFTTDEVTGLAIEMGVKVGIYDGTDFMLHKIAKHLLTQDDVQYIARLEEIEKAAHKLLQSDREVAELSLSMSKLEMRIHELGDKS